MSITDYANPRLIIMMMLTMMEFELWEFTRAPKHYYSSGTGNMTRLKSLMLQKSGCRYNTFKALFVIQISLK